MECMYVCMYVCMYIYMWVSTKGGIPKSSFSLINHPSGGTTIYGNPHIYIYTGQRLGVPRKAIEVHCGPVLKNVIIHCV